MHTPITVTAATLRTIAANEPRGHLVIGRGTAGAWSVDASAVEKADADLLATARARGLYDEAQERGMCDRDGRLLGDAWLLVVGTHVQHSDLDTDPAVIAYCDAD
jgi:hypothetical protein